MFSAFGVEHTIAKGMKVKNLLSLRRVARHGAPGKAKDYANAKYRLRYHPRRDAVDDTLHAQAKKEMGTAVRVSRGTREKNKKSAFGIPEGMT